MIRDIERAPGICYAESSTSPNLASAEDDRLRAVDIVREGAMPALRHAAAETWGLVSHRLTATGGCGTA